MEVNICIGIPNLRCEGVWERMEIEGLPSGNEIFFLCRFVERTLVDTSECITRFNGLEIDESLFKIDPAHVHLAGVAAEQRIIASIPTGGSQKSPGRRTLNQ